MTDILLPTGQNLRNAVCWISEVRVRKGEDAMPDILNKVGERFNFSPLQTNTLDKYLGNLDAVCAAKKKRTKLLLKTQPRLSKK